MAIGIITDREDLFSLENLYHAYQACRMNKRKTINALRFEVNLFDNLCDLRQELRAYGYSGGMVSSSLVVPGSHAPRRKCPWGAPHGNQNPAFVNDIGVSPPSQIQLNGSDETPRNILA